MLLIWQESRNQQHGPSLWTIRKTKQFLKRKNKDRKESTENRDRLNRKESSWQETKIQKHNHLRKYWLPKCRSLAQTHTYGVIQYHLALKATIIFLGFDFDKPVWYFLIYEHIYKPILPISLKESPKMKNKQLKCDFWFYDCCIVLIYIGDCVKLFNTNIENQESEMIIKKLLLHLWVYDQFIDYLNR